MNFYQLGNLSNNVSNDQLIIERLIPWKNYCGKKFEPQ